MMRAGGFTFIELMITIAVVAIILGIAVPNFQDWIVKNSAKTTAHEIFATLANARLQAIRLGKTTGVCPVGEVDSGSGWVPSTSDTCGGTSNWRHGWISFIDSNKNGKRDDEERITAKHGPLKRKNDGLSGPAYIGFDSVGARKDWSGDPTGWIGHFRLCPQIDNRERYWNYGYGIVVNKIGRVRMEASPYESMRHIMGLCPKG